MTWVMSLTVGRRCQIDTELDFLKTAVPKPPSGWRYFPGVPSVLPELILMLIHVRLD